MIWNSVIPDVSVGIGAGSVSVTAIFIYLYRAERNTNKSLVDTLMKNLIANTQAITRLCDLLENRSVCPMSGAEMKAMVDRMRMR